MKKVMIFILIFCFLNSCNKEETRANSMVLETSNKPVLFVIAGQSNAEGAIFLNGLSLLQEAIPISSNKLSNEERKRARAAVANSLGVFCEVEQPCIDNPAACPDTPFSLTAADVVVDELMRSSIDWRQITGAYQHPTVQLIAANYYNSNVSILDENGEEVDNENCTFLSENTAITGPFLERYTTTEVVPLGPGFGAETENGILSFGPELGFGLRVAQAMPKATFLKVTMGGSSLNDSWRSSGTLYQALISETQKALNSTGSTLGGFVWFQGFNDQFEDAYCEPLPGKYEANLSQFISNIKKDLSAPDLPIIIVEARNGGELPIIQQAQNAVAAADAMISLVVSKDLSECFHYDSGSQIIIGERSAEAMLELIKK